MGVDGSSSKRRSRLVRMPTSRLASSVMGTPEMWKRAIRSSASCTGWWACRVTGSVIIPDSDRFTRSTSCDLVLGRSGCGGSRRARRGGPARWPCGTR